MAYRKPSKQSSTGQAYGKPNDAVEANDGELSTRSITKVDNPSWWQVDLQHIIQIQRIELYLWPYYFNKQDHYGDVSIKTRQRGQDLFVLCVSLGVPTTINNTLTCSIATLARFVRVSMENGKGELALAEVEVYGTVIKPGN